MRKLALVLMVVLWAAGAQAQTFDVFGGKITNADSTTATTCSAYNPNYNYTGASISGSGTTATITVSGPSANTVIASTVYPKMMIYIIGGSNSGFDVTAGTGVQGTVTSPTTITYANTTVGSGTGYTVAVAAPWLQEVNKHWWWCMPTGNEFFPEGPTYPLDSIHGTFNPVGVNQRIQSAGFNTVQIGALSYLYPINTTNPGPSGETVKMPFITSINAAYYSVTEPQTCGGLPIANPPKDMFRLRPAAYNAYAGYLGAADYYDSTNMAAWMSADLACDHPWIDMGNSPYLGYLLAIASDDSDNMSGISGGGPSFPTIPPSNNTYNMGFLVATISPLETAATNTMARSGANFVYTHTQIYSKLALRNALATEYGTIGAMNTAWGSSYTTFDSSGTCVGSQPITCGSSVAADSVGTGDGSTLTFSTTLSHHTSVAPFSVQVLVAGTPVAGDLGTEGSASYTFYGPNVSSGNVNATTGALTITFTAGHAPANLAAITATYVDCGWGCGTGFLDEDDRASHQSWMGHDFIGLTTASAAVQTDINTFFQAIAGTYFSTMRTGIKAVFPWVPYIGPNTLGTWGCPPAAPVLKAASQYLDAFIGTMQGGLYTQAETDFVATNFGNRPVMPGSYTSANADSAVDSSYPSGPGVDYPTQAARAAAYYSRVQGQLTTASTTAGGDFPYLGIYWWEYVDQAGQLFADGIVDATDNAYNGNDAASGSVTCGGVTATPNTCGSEPAPTACAGYGGSCPGAGSPAPTRPFGDLFHGTNGIINANLLWAAQNYGAPAAPVLPPLNLGIVVH